MTYPHNEYDFDDDERSHYRHRPRVRGCNVMDGPCGAPDCPTCHPEWQSRCPECGFGAYWDESTHCPQCGETVED